MSGLKSEVDALYNAKVESQNMRVVQYPVAWGGFNLVSDAAAGAGVWMMAGGGAAYGVAVPIATIPDPCWLVGLSVGLPVVGAFYADVKIATGAIGAEVDLAQWSIGTNVWVVVEWQWPTLYCPPIKIIGQPRVAFDIRKDTAASLAGFNGCYVLLATGLGT